MTLRERVFDELSGDLEYHPRRGFLYLLLAAGVFSTRVFLTLPEQAALRLILVLGGLALLLKGFLLLRKSSEGLALTQGELDRLSTPERRKPLPPLHVLAAQVVQDFGAGIVLFTPFLHSMQSIDERWDFPALPVFGAGLILFAVGWLARHFAAL